MPLLITLCKLALLTPLDVLAVQFIYLFIFLLYIPLTQNFMVIWQGLTPYEKKKYVWKMLYIYMLGYDVDFGHMEAVSLISAPKYPEKQVIY